MSIPEGLLPSGVDPDDEIEVEWQKDDLGVTLTASLGEASVTIRSSYEHTDILAWIAAALPSILAAAMPVIEGEEGESVEDEEGDRE